MEETQFKCRPVFRCITFGLCVCCYCFKIESVRNYFKITGWSMSGLFTCTQEQNKKTESENKIAGIP